MSVTPWEFKDRQRSMWGAGDYATLAPHIADVGEVVVERAGVEPEMQVLDVGCGTGNAALPAARRGARVTGLDLVPSLLEGGRMAAEAEGIEVEWVEGDAEELPFEDDSFDRVLSTFGHMFAPRHRQAAGEMARVCRDGGAVVIACWTPEGAAGDIFRTNAKYMPPPPDFASPPILWGTEDHVREMFPTAGEFEFERHVTRLSWDSVEGFADHFAENFGPVVTAKQMLGDRFPELRADLIEVWKARNESEEGGFILPQEYLLSIVRF